MNSRMCGVQMYACTISNQLNPPSRAKNATAHSAIQFSAFDPRAMKEPSASQLSNHVCMQPCHPYAVINSSISNESHSTEWELMRQKLLSLQDACADFWLLRLTCLDDEIGSSILSHSARASAKTSPPFGASRHSPHTVHDLTLTI